jgi:predicted DCC family thiol-disulfide oxidoreductase YuxK
MATTTQPRSAQDTGAARPGAADPRPVVLYDADCGFCRWSLAKLLALDPRRRLRPVALQSPEADDLLAGMDGERRMASWHLVDREGAVFSGGGAFAPLLRELPGGRPLARLPAGMPRLADRAYYLVAGRRGALGRAPVVHRPLRARAPGPPGGSGPPLPGPGGRPHGRRRDLGRRAGGVPGARLGRLALAAGGVRGPAG